MTGPQATEVGRRLPLLATTLERIRRIEATAERAATDDDRQRWSRQLRLADGAIRLPGRGLDRSMREAFARPSEVARYTTMVDVTLAGDRVLDLGCGPGLVGTVLALNRPIGHYLGIDLNPDRIERARHLAASNGLEHLLEFATADIDDHLASDCGTAPSLITVLEVLEHLDDPTTTLASIAQACSPDTTVAFSVPLFGRIEHCWGHRSLFGIDTVVAMCADAGLEVVGANDVYNQWLVCTARPAATEPAPNDAERPLAGGSPAVVRHPPVRKLPATRYLSFESGPPEHLEIRIPAGRSTTLEFPTPAMVMARYEFEFEPGHEPSAVTLAALDADNGTVGRWEVDPGALRGGRRTIVLQPGWPHPWELRPATIATAAPIASVTMSVQAGPAGVDGKLWRVGFAAGHEPIRHDVGVARRDVPRVRRNHDHLRTRTRLVWIIAVSQLQAGFHRLRRMTTTSWNRHRAT